ncbi:MAG: PQQ-dependent sugar dehydrogenase [Pirellulales bacterium]|nr:PQQ-dependent sugar dehydrogenase [Pirellulales bacterium]
MTLDELCLALVAFFLGACATSAFRFATCRTLPSLLSLLITSIGLGCVVWLCGKASPDTSFAKYFWSVVVSPEPRSFLALALGVALALPWFALTLVRATQLAGFDRRIRATLENPLLAWCEHLILSVAAASVLLVGGLLVWNGIYDIEIGTRASVVDESRFVVEDVATFKRQPIRVAVDPGSGRVFVSVMNEDQSVVGGAIYEIDLEAEKGRRERVVAESPVLFRAFGLACRDGDLFVSRAGFSPITENGQIAYEPRGAVTQLRDLDGDGYYEYYDDIVSELPGLRGPDPLHQNYGLAFGPDGSLFIANAFVSNRAIEDDPLSGVILRLPSGTKETEIFARGFRNPVGLTVNPDGELFATDNDVEENPGDELNHVVRGGHYGHPYYVPNETGVEQSGFKDPILVSEHPHSNYLGLAYGYAEALPDRYRDVLFLCDLIRGEVLAVRVKSAQGTYEAVEKPELFASVPSPIDVAVAPDGSIYVVSLYDRKLIRIRPRTTAKHEAVDDGR